MKLLAAINGAETEVNIHLETESVHAEIDSRVYDVRLQPADGNRLLLISAGQVLDCRIEGELRSGAAIEVVMGTNRYPMVITDPKRWRSASPAGAHTSGAANIVAPMPGKIVRILAQAGDQVEVGAGIVVVEAMKMQNELKSPKAGQVAAIKVEVGTTVNGGDVLAVIE